MVNSLVFGEKEEHILNIAMEVFTEKGFDGAKMQEIADRAGINKALLHYYFRNKERLYSHVFKMVFSKFMLNWTDIFGGEGSLKEVIRIFIDRFIDHIKKDPRIPMFIAHELGKGGGTVSSVIAEFSKQLPESGPWKLLVLIARAKEKGEIRSDVDPRQFIVTLLGACVYFFIAEPIITRLFSDPEPFDRERFLEERKESILHTLFHGIQLPGEK